MVNTLRICFVSGSYGWFFVGFSEKGEMCAMKEVKLSSGDAKSTQAAKALEIVSFLG